MAKSVVDKKMRQDSLLAKDSGVISLGKETEFFYYDFLFLMHSDASVQ